MNWFIYITEFLTQHPEYAILLFSSWLVAIVRMESKKRKTS